MKYQDVIKELHLKLPTYLESQGIVINEQGFFCCIHPDHPDKNPSCSLNFGNKGYEGKVFHCFSGNGHDGNIFTAAHWLEGMPIQDKDFWDITMVELCKRYEIPFEPLEVDEDTRRKYQGIRSNADASRIIHNTAYENKKLRSTHIGIKHLLDRGITEETIKEWGIGILTSFREYQLQMEKLGHTDQNFLNNMDLLNKNLFNRDSFIIPIKSITNQVAGFVSRNCRMTVNEKGNRKYTNTINSMVYKKGEILFGYNDVKNKKGPLFIVEGYLDAIYLRQCGLERVVALGSTVLTEYHIDELLFTNENDIVLCLDADDAGDSGTELAINRMAKYTKYNVTIINLPRNSDPDSFVQEYGLEKFLELPRSSPFEWSLSHAKYSDDLNTVAQNMVPVIASEQSTIARRKMIEELSRFTAIPEIDIRKDVDALINKDDDKYINDIHDINQYVRVQLDRRKASDTKSILADAITKITVLDEKRASSFDLKSEYFNQLNELDTKIQRGDYKYGLLSPKFKSFEQQVDGWPYWATMSVFAGRASAGKCLGIDTPVMMYDGTIKKVQDVVVGDKLMGPDSKPRTVLSLARGKENMYTVKQNKADDYRVNESHILSLKRSFTESKHKHGDILNIPIKEYVNKSDRFKRCYKGYKTAVIFDEQNIRIDPHYLGLWLADGKSTDTRIYKTDTQIIDYIYSYAKSEGLVVSEGDKNRPCHSYAIIGDDGNMKKRLRNYNLLDNKHVPLKYICNSLEVRRQLLAGIIDGDGHYNSKSNYYELSFRSKKLFDSVKYLCNTLGLRTSVGKPKIIKGVAYHRMNISGDLHLIPCVVDRKKARKQTTNRDHTMTGITVELDSYDDYYGFTLDGDHLFLLGDCTVTHNTAFLTSLGLDIITANPDAAIFYMSIDDNTALLTRKMLAVLTGMTTTQIKGYKDMNMDQKDLYHEAMGFLKANSERFIIVDANKGNTPEALENHVRWFSKEFEKSPKMFFLDNFHKLSVDTKGKNQRNDTLTDASSQIKTMTQVYDIHIAMTAELRKLAHEKDRPTRQDLQGTNKLDYDADLVGLVHNDMMVNKEDSTIKHIRTINGTVTEMPWIEVDVAKNKINGRANFTQTYKYHTDNMRFEEGDFNEWRSMRYERKDRSNRSIV